LEITLIAATGKQEAAAIDLLRFESKRVALIDNQPHYVGGERSTLEREHQRKRRELFDKTETKRSAIAGVVAVQASDGRAAHHSPRRRMA